jgi:hypothetical protein
MEKAFGPAGRWAGFFLVTVVLVANSCYVVIVGNVAYSAGFAVVRGFTEGTLPQYSAGLGNGRLQAFVIFLVIVTAISILYRGVQKGIERVSKLFVPFFGLMIITLIVMALDLPGATAGLEEQGAPFVMHPGDCVLQPPHIRHRVLECSDQMEVIEITCPAEHETLVDHDLELPTDRIDRGRRFDGQRFVYDPERSAKWEADDVEGFEKRELGIGTATGGLVSARVIRAMYASASPVLLTDRAFQFNVVLQGRCELQIGGRQSGSFRRGDAFTLTAAAPSPCLLAADSGELEIRQVTSEGPAGAKSGAML